VALTDDRNIQSHMILHVILRIILSATTCTHAEATNLFLLLIFYVSGNSFQQTRDLGE